MRDRTWEKRGEIVVKHKKCCSTLIKIPYVGASLVRFAMPKYAKLYYSPLLLPCSITLSQHFAPNQDTRVKFVDAAFTFDHEVYYLDLWEHVSLPRFSQIVEIVGRFFIIVICKMNIDMIYADKPMNIQIVMNSNYIVR